MKSKLCCAILTAACCLAATTSSVAQSYDVTFKVPLNLTRIPTLITKVKVVCVVRSDALISANNPGTAAANTEFPVSGGQVVTTATVVVPISRLDTSNGKTTAYYSCELQGWKNNDWVTPDRLGLSPMLDPVTGTFTW